MKKLYSPHSRIVVVMFPLRAETAHDGSTYPRLISTLSVLDDITSLYEVGEGGIFMFPARGPARYFGGEAVMSQHVHSTLKSLFPDEQCGVGIGDSRFVARIAALHSVDVQSPVCISSVDTPDLLSRLPVTTLTDHGFVNSDIVSIFQRLGLHTLEKIVALGEAALVDRFGSSGRDVFAIAIGDEISSFSPLPDHSSISVTCDFDNETQHSLSEAMNNSEIVLSIMQPFILNFTESLSRHGVQCLRMRILCETENTERSERIWSDSRGFTQLSVRERLAWQLNHWFRDAENDNSPTSWITRIVIDAIYCRPFTGVQETFWGGRSENTERMTRALSRVATIHDGISITVPQWQGGRDIVTYKNVKAAEVDLDDLHNESVSGASREWNGGLPPPRPIMVFNHPRPVVVCDEQHQSIFVTGRHELSGIPTNVILDNDASWEVVSWAGPWPVEERWWDPQRWRRHARLQVLVRKGEVSTVWLLSIESRQWGIVGIYH